MSRNRAERRHNTRKKAARRHRLATDWGMCGCKVTPSGEATNCLRCITENHSRWALSYLSSAIRKKDDAWWAAQV